MDDEALPSTATLVAASKRMLEELANRKLPLPAELQRVQDLLDMIESNSQRISLALLENRRRKAPSDHSKSLLPELLREQEQYLQQVRRRTCLSGPSDAVVAAVWGNALETGAKRRRLASAQCPRPPRHHC